MKVKSIFAYEENYYSLFIFIVNPSSKNPSKTYKPRKWRPVRWIAQWKYYQEYSELLKGAYDYNNPGEWDDPDADEL